MIKVLEYLRVSQPVRDAELPLRWMSHRFSSFALIPEFRQPQSPILKKGLDTKCHVHSQHQRNSNGRIQ